MKNRHTVPDHERAARDARFRPGVWVPGPVYPTLSSADAAVRRMPKGRCSLAYTPLGAFEGYAARCVDGGALWVRYVGDGPALEPLPQRMTVRVPDYGNRPGYEGVRIVTVSIRPTCPVCGGPRGRAEADPFTRDGVTHVRDRWANQCGHQDVYDAVLDEARRMPAAPGGRTPEDAPALRLPALRVLCPKCDAKAGALCTSHNGARFRLLDVHQSRTDAWHVARVRSVPAAALILDEAKRRRGMHARQAADLIAGHGYPSEAKLIDTELTVQRGHMSAKQAALLLIEHAYAAQGGEGRWLLP